MTTTLLNVSHVRVWPHLTHSSTGSEINKVFIENDGGLVLSIQNEAGKVYHFDNSSQKDLLLQVDRVFQGYDIGILNLTIGENRPVCEFKNDVIAILKHLSKEIKNETDVISFAALGINDTSCIDLVDYSKLEITSFSANQHQTDKKLSQLFSVLSNDIALPLIVTLNIQRQTPQGTITNGTLMLGDLGGTCLSNYASGPLDRSLQRLNGLILELEQPFINNQVNFEESPLTALLKPYINSSGDLIIRANIIQNGSIKALINGLLLLSTFRKVKNYPAQKHVDQKIKRLADLENLNNNLQSDKKQAQRDSRELRKCLDELDEERKGLKRELDLQRCSNECERFEKEYLAATMELQALDLKDRLRKCEIDLLSLDQLNVKLKLEKQLILDENFQQLEQVLKSKESLQIKHTEEVGDLSNKFSHASQNLEKSRLEAERLKSEISKANDQVSQLTTALNAKQKEHEHIVTKMANSPTKLIQEKEIYSLKKQLETTRSTEEKLTALLSRNEERTEDQRKLLSNLERQLNDLKIENARLQQYQQPQPKYHKEVITTSPNKNTMMVHLNKLEAEMKADRKEIHSILKQVQETVAQKRKTTGINDFANSTEKKFKAQKQITKPEPSSDYNCNNNDGDNGYCNEPFINTVQNELQKSKQKELKSDLIGLSAKNIPIKNEIKLAAVDAPPKNTTKKSAIIQKRKEHDTNSYNNINTILKKQIVSEKQPIIKEKKEATVKETMVKPLITPDSPSKYKPSSFRPQIKKTDENSTILDNIFKDHSRENSIKIPEKIQLVAPTYGNNKENGGLRANNMDKDALKNIVTNMTIKIEKQ